MEERVRRYYQLKKKQKEIEDELAELRAGILSGLEEQGLTGAKYGPYQVKVVAQERKEYDDAKLYEALPDPAVWRLLSKADGAKVASLIKLNVIGEDTVKDTYAVKKVSLLQVDKI